MRQDQQSEDRVQATQAEAEKIIKDTEGTTFTKDKSVAERLLKRFGGQLPSEQNKSKEE
jgi:hypothetical protein